MVAARSWQAGTGPGAGGLAAWAERSGRRRAEGTGRGGLRFAFYGRVSTEDWQDPESSLARQLAQAEALVCGHGRIVARFCDVGQSRSVAWGRRPQAAVIIAALADPGRGWDAVVVGEYERAFYGSQYAMVAPLLQHYGVQLWMPEAGGKVDFASEHDERAMTGLGLSSKREVARTSIRVRTAMATQTREQRRYLGGRPPYGYRLGDAGPHPNKAHAAWDGARTSWSRTRRPRMWCGGSSPAPRGPLGGADRAGAERGRRAVPSATDPKRNPHRPGTGWTLGTVTTILGNPRYTGHQVWNRQRTDKDLADPADVSLGHKSVQRWNLPDGWVISRNPAHQALVSEDDFIAAQDVNAARGPSRQTDPAGPQKRRYLLAGLLKCAVCGRRMESAWSNGKPAYRCRHGHTTASLPDPDRPKKAHVREDRILPHLAALHLLLTEPAGGPWRRRTRRGADVRYQIDEEVIRYLREQQITLTYDPATETLRAGAGQAAQTITLKAS